MNQHADPDNPTRAFTFMLDGIGDPSVARGITRDLKDRLGLISRCDPAGMWLEVESEGVEPIDEAFADRVIEIARHHGLEPRDRVGSSFVSTISIEQLRKRLVSEWNGRFATALVFLLPALGVYYLRPFLMGTTSYYLPNGIVAVLVGWTIIAGGWPIIYQGFVSAVSFRITPDLFQSTLILVSFGAGIWQTVTNQPVTTLNLTAFAVLSMAFQRKRIWQNASRTAGQAHLMLPFGRVLLIVGLSSLVVCWFDLVGGLAMMLAVPAMMGLVSINRLAPPALWVIPIMFFVVLIGGSPLLVPMDLAALTSARAEAAFGYVMLLTLLCTHFAPLAGED